MAARRRGIVLAWYAAALVAGGAWAWWVGWGGLAGGCWVLSLGAAAEAGDLLGVL